jgi:hypothetical protein
MKPFMARLNSSREDSPDRSEDCGGDRGCGERAGRVAPRRKAKGSRTPASGLAIGLLVPMTRNW